MTDQVNIPLLRKAVEWAEAEAAKPLVDREWLQGGWVTSGRDLAVEIAYMMGDDDPSLDFHQTVGTLTPLCGTAYCIAGYIGQSVDGRYAKDDVVDGVHVSVFAERALGLPRGAASALFAGGNDIAEVRTIAEEIAGERL